MVLISKLFVIFLLIFTIQSNIEFQNDSSVGRINQFEYQKLMRERNKYTFSFDPFGPKNQVDHIPTLKEMIYGDIPKPLRITYNTKKLSQIDSKYKELIPFVEKQLDLQALYFSKLLKITRKNERYNMFPKYLEYCNGIKVNSLDIRKGIEHSDLHIHVLFTDDPEQSYIARASACVLEEDTNRPKFGKVEINLSFLKNEINKLDKPIVNLQYQNVLRHEILHVLGFEFESIFFWNLKNSHKYIEKKTIRGFETSILTSPKVQKEVRNHYNCPTARGMQLENQGEQGSLNSHWETTILSNELMTAGSVDETSTQLSRITLALLEDSGWYYPDYSMADDIQWGKNQGCDFLEFDCTDSNLAEQYEEFSRSQTSCSFFKNGYSGLYKISFSDECYINMNGYSTCYNTQQSSLFDFGQFGSEKKQDVNKQLACFDSNSYLNKCYEFKCDDQNNIYIIQDNQSFQCNKEKNECRLNSNEIVKTPLQWDEFCNGVPKPFCQNSCSQNGTCSQGKCICFDEYEGDDCSIPIENVKQKFELDSSAISIIIFCSLNFLILGIGLYYRLKKPRYNLSAEYELPTLVRFRLT